MFNRRLWIKQLKIDENINKRFIDLKEDIKKICDGVLSVGELGMLQDVEIDRINQKIKDLERKIETIGATIYELHLKPKEKKSKDLKKKKTK